MSGFRRRLTLLLGSVSAAALAAGAGTTQFVAWMLNYDPALGRPVFAHVYWPWKIIEWWTAPWEPDFSRPFDLARTGLVMACALGAMAFIKIRQLTPRSPPLDGYGSAAFMTPREVRASPLFPKGNPGIVVGGWKDEKGTLHYLTDAGQGHVLCTGPTRIGKTASTILPTLLSNPCSAVVFDPKGEIYRLTAGWRAEEADNVILRFAPAEIENTICWNPFDRARAGTQFAYRDVANIVQQIADPRSKDDGDHWEEMAGKLMDGLAMMLVSEGRCSPAGLLTALSASSNPSALFNAMAGHRIAEVADEGRSLQGTPEKERGSIVSAARRRLMRYRDPILAKNTSRSDFFIGDLMAHDRPVTLYIETRGEDQDRMRPVVRLLISLIIGQLISLDDYTSCHDVLLAIDELPSLKLKEPLELFLAKGAGAKMRALLLAQDYQDIVAVYGQHERVTAECSVMSAHAPNSLLSADMLSKRLGNKTVIVEQISESQGRGQMGRSTNRSLTSYSRPLMTPDEVMRMALPKRNAFDEIDTPGEMLIFQAGQRAILGTQSLAFLDPEFVRRMAIPAPPTMRIRP